MYPWAATEMLFYYYYFNRMSVLDIKEKEEVPNYWRTGLKVTTYKVIK